MTIGVRLIQGLPIQAVGLVYQAATANPIISSPMETTEAGGRLIQRPVPTPGSVLCTTSTTMSPVLTSLGTLAGLLVASGIKT